MTILVLAQAAESEAVAWWALVPLVVLFTLTAATIPVWPWSRGWGWNIAAMSGVAMLTAGTFTLAWLAS